MPNPATAKAEKKKLPGWARWLCGYAAVLGGCAGLVYFWRVVFFTQPGLPALPFTLGAMGIGTALYAALFLITRIKGEGGLCLKAAMVVFALGLLYVFGTAPLQVPDETGYYLRANAISRGEFVYRYEEDYPRDVDLLVEKFFPVGGQPLNFRVAYQGAEMAPAAFVEYREALESGAQARQPVNRALVFLNLPFLHQGLFIAVARLFGFTALGQLYAARMANLLVYAVICYFAFRNARRYRAVFFAFALLPLSLFMAASCSYDGLLLALSYLALSVACRDEVDGRALVVFGAAVLLANYMKPLSFLLAPAILLLVPASRWKLKAKKLKPWMAGLACAVAAVAFWFVMDRVDRQISYAGGWPPPEELPRGSGDAAGQGGQMAFILQNPFRFIATTLLSVYEADGFLFDLGRLGHMDMVIPLAGGLSLLSLLAATVLAARDKEDAKTWRIWALLGLALVYAAAVLGGMYVTDTDVGSIRITGQQPRYFLPAFLLMGLALAMVWGRALRPRLGGAGAGSAPRGSLPALSAARAEETALWLAAAVALLVAVLLAQNYFIGQWIPRAEGGWKLVNLFGWQKT